MNEKADTSFDPLLSVVLLTILLALLMGTLRAASHFETAQTMPAHVLYLSSDGSRVIAQR